MNIIPLLAYRWADPHTTSWHQTYSRADESRTRLWTIVKYKRPGDKIYSTAEFRVIIELMPDFCGGCIVHSPQVRIRTQGDWGSEEFANPGSGIGLSFDWEFVDEPNRAIDLAAVTGKEEWDKESLTAYAYKCMAQGIGTYLMTHGQRSFMSTDRRGGKMSCLIEAMKTMGQIPVMFTHHAWADSILDDGSETPRVVRNLSQPAISVWFESLPTHQWYNKNSGNNVSWLPVLMKTLGDDADEEDWCHDCDEPLHICGCNGREGVDISLHSEVSKCYADPIFVRGAPRKFWRNG